MACQDCGGGLEQFPANRPVADFHCPDCGAVYELKSTAKKFGRTLANGAYSKKLERLKSGQSPHLLLLRYDQEAWRVLDLVGIPRHFFSMSIIKARNPLAPTARRAGWVGSTINLHLIPMIGRINLMQGGQMIDRRETQRRWRDAKFLDGIDHISRGWTIDVMNCVERIPEHQFTLEDVYAFEDHLRRLHPGNANIRPKIRQQLQVLRDANHLVFLGRGRYEKTTPQ